MYTCKSETKILAPRPCTLCVNLLTNRLVNLRDNEKNGILTIEYHRLSDGCREAKIFCGEIKV